MMSQAKANFFRKLKHLEGVIYAGNFRKPYACPRRTGLRKDLRRLSFHSGLMPRVSTNLVKCPRKTL